jgi:hypothetical protein
MVNFQLFLLVAFVDVWSLVRVGSGYSVGRELGRQGAGDDMYWRERMKLIP